MSHFPAEDLMLPEMADEAIYQTPTTIKTIQVNFVRANAPVIVGGVEVICATPMALCVTSDVLDASVANATLTIADITYNVFDVEVQGDNTTILKLTLD